VRVTWILFCEETTFFNDGAVSSAHLPQINNNFITENTARTQNEQQLCSAWQQSEMDKKQMLTTIHDLNEQLKVMKLEIEKLKLNQKPREITSLEELNDGGDLAEDTELV
jgi:hypothetical protein